MSGDKVGSQRGKKRRGFLLPQGYNRSLGRLELERNVEFEKRRKPFSRNDTKRSGVSGRHTCLMSSIIHVYLQ
jgi:hypothetical protein